MREHGELRCAARGDAVRGGLWMAALALGMQGPNADAATELGWADEFFGGIVPCTTTLDTCGISSSFLGPAWINPSDPYNAPTWSYVGMQGTDPVGRSNARSKVSTKFYENDTTGGRMLTTTLSRKRVLWPNFPSPGALCPGNIIGTFVTSQSFVIDSMSVPSNTHFE